MKKYPFIKKIGKSLVPSDFYTQIIKEPMQYAFLYMFLFILLLSVIVGGYRGYELNRTFTRIIDEYEQGIIPPFKISKDGLSIEGDAVITIDYFDIPIVMHDEGLIDINDVMHYENVILLEKDRIVIASRNMDLIVTDYTSLNNTLQMLLLDEFDSEKHLKLFFGGGILMIPITIMIQFFVTTISFFYYSFFVLMIANLLRTVLGLGMKLGKVYHMVIYAMTFSTFWTNFSMILPRSVPMFLDTFVHFVLPTLILLNVFMTVRKNAIDKMNH